MRPNCVSARTVPILLLLVAGGCSKPTAGADCPITTPAARSAPGKAQLGSGDRATPAPPDTGAGIPVARLRRERVIGDLGWPLGTIITVEGDVLPDNHRRKVDQGKILLRVRSAGGKALPKTLVLTLRGDKDVRGLKPGSAVRLLIYETGGFSGAPSGLFKYVPAFTTVGHGFYTSLNVVKILP